VASFYKQTTAAASEAQAPAEEMKAHAESSRALDDLADFCYKLGQQQVELSHHIDSLHTEIKIIASQPASDAAVSSLADLKLHLARIDAELFNTWHRLDTLEHSFELGLEALKENKGWADERTARLAWAQHVAADKAQKTMSDFEKLSESAKAGERERMQNSSKTEEKAPPKTKAISKNDRPKPKFGARPKQKR
jgi:hypothetical protein